MKRRDVLGLSLATGLMGFAAGMEIDAGRGFVAQKQACEKIEKTVGQESDSVKREGQESRRLSAECVKESTETTARCEQIAATCDSKITAIDAEVKELQSTIADCGAIIKDLSGAVEVNKACCDASNAYVEKLEADLAACKK